MSLIGERSHLEPGHRLDRYELLCPIAHGGMASVWLARFHGKHGFEKLVAVKTILPQFASDPRFQRMFLDEARIASGIDHTNVARILDLGEQHDVLYLVMEWIDGDSLSKLHRAVRKHDHPMPAGVVLRIMADISAGLHAAHELHDASGEDLGVVHRDVSPQNILLGVNGTAKLIDFGIAKARDRVSGDTSAGLLKGKIQYMAPEQAIGKSVDRRADVWAIGAVTYYLLTGAPPYDGANQLATLHMLTSGEPPPPLPPEFPRELDALCQRALAYDLDARTATAADLQREMESLMISARCHTTTSDVAAFARQYVGDRAEARRRAIDIALQAGHERRRVQSLLLIEPSESSDSIPPRAAAPKPPPSDRPSYTPTDHAPPSLNMGEPRRAEAEARGAPPPRSANPVSLDGMHIPAGAGMHASSHPASIDGPVSQITSGTLGSAVVAFPGGGLGSRRGRQFWAAAAIGVFGAVAFVGVLGIASLLLRSGTSNAGKSERAPSVATAQPAPPSSPAPDLELPNSHAAAASDEEVDAGVTHAEAPKPATSATLSRAKVTTPKPPPTPPKKDYGF